MRDHDIIHWHALMYPTSRFYEPTDEVNYKARWRKVVNNMISETRVSSQCMYKI